jgi:RNA polymerase sigma factor (sigma-70 family)
LAVRETAAQLIWQRYFPKLLVLASGHLDNQIRGREDEEDVLQTMYKSFVLRRKRGEFDIANRDELWKLLVTITLNKARNAANRNRAASRDVRRERSASPRRSDQSAADNPGELRRALQQMETGEPSPADAALLNEALQRRLDALVDPELRQIALWKLEGWTNAEVGDRLGYTERTVERKLSRIRREWDSLDKGSP